MKRARAWLLLPLLLLMTAGTAHAHIGSPDVFLDGEAGPYRLLVTVRVPQVIPGIATIEVRAPADVDAISVVPMRLTGPGSEHPPTADLAARSTADRQLFSANLWLMERGSMQVRVTVAGKKGPGVLSVPVPAAAQTTLAMPRGLGALLFGLMALLACAIVAIVVGALREATLPAGAPPTSRRRGALVVVALIVGGAIWLGNMWWTAVAADYARMAYRPWHPVVRVDGCKLKIADEVVDLLADHGHDMHLFLVRAGALDRLAHLHPLRDASRHFTEALPPLSAGHYLLFADIVLPTGFPTTGTAELDLPELHCAAPTGDDALWAGTAGGTLAGGARMIWDRPAELRAGDARPLTFRVVEADGSPATIEPYMGMAAHAEVVRSDGTVFAHLHPNGSVAMPALELVQPMSSMSGMAMGPLSPSLAFPFGFPRPGDYRVFVQIKRAGVIETAAFDAHVL